LSSTVTLEQDADIISEGSCSDRGLSQFSAVPPGKFQGAFLLFWCYSPVRARSPQL